MDLFPQDFDERMHAKLVQRRTGVAAATGEVQSAQVGWWGRLWTAGTSIPEERVPQALGSAKVSIFSSVMGATLCGGIAGMLALAIISDGLGLKGPLPFLLVGPSIGMLLSYVWPRAILKSLHRPIQTTELDSLISAAPDELQKALLELARDAIRLPLDKEASARARSGILALCEACQRLPVMDVEALDSAALRQQVDELRARAVSEPDRPTAESLERQADAVTSRIEAHEHASVLARRSRALRDEIMAQIAAVRESLAASQLDTFSLDALLRLADAARGVSDEVVGTAVARQELDVATGTRPAEQAEASLRQELGG